MFFSYAVCVYMFFTRILWRRKMQGKVHSSRDELLATEAEYLADFRSRRQDPPLSIKQTEICMWNCSTRPRRTANRSSGSSQSMDALLPPPRTHPTHLSTYPAIQPSNPPTSYPSIQPSHPSNHPSNHPPNSQPTYTNPTCHYQHLPSINIRTPPLHRMRNGTSVLLVLVLTGPFALSPSPCL